MSLGRQPPPNPMPALRNRRPIRASCPIASARVVTSAPVASAISAMALMKEILVARKALADDLHQLGGRVDRSRCAGCPVRERRCVDRVEHGRRSSRRPARRRRRNDRGRACRTPRNPPAGTPGSTRAAPRSYSTPLGETRGRADGHGRLADDEVAGGRGAAEERRRPRRRSETSAALPPGDLRRADRDEVHASRPAASAMSVREAQPTVRVADEQFGQARLEEGRAPGGEHPTFVLVDDRCRRPHDRAPPCTRRARRRDTRNR